MSGVDVLAVMREDYLDASIERQWNPHAPELAAASEEARAAVAELLEAANATVSLISLGLTPSGNGLRMALARCKGGAA